MPRVFYVHRRTCGQTDLHDENNKRISVILHFECSKNRGQESAGWLLGYQTYCRLLLCLKASARDYLVKSLFLYVTTYYSYVWTFSVSVKMEATGLYDTSLGVYRTTQSHISNTETLYGYFREKLKFPLLRRFSTRVANCLPTFRDRFLRL